ncbi:putative membrane protein YdgH [Posidoniimonas corsicana]|uniref:Putative membrane protein YdgH n=1 Tax=Posidoniimonas corsicana TaxID=1938618 RepID=A0A5C5VIZ6_9BACT|nr:MMPL family transporter [Posidoniimonas corsicana]TWT38071.1 putative membrane protein YdgH [Posidoniimonas corsicana]
MSARFLRQLANKYWVAVLLAWVVLAVALRSAAPPWESVAYEGDLEHLPRTAASVAADELLHEAFPAEATNSELVLLFDRGGDPLTVDDRQFVLDLALQFQAAEDLPVVGVWHAKSPLVSRMLLAPGERAEMVILRLSNPLMAVDNIRVLQAVTERVDERMSWAPPGLRFAVTGSAAIGADTLSAARDSLRATHRATLLLVLGCLILIYRAPLLVLIPLATIGLSVSVATSLIVILADYLGPGGALDIGLKVFTTTKVFVIVILFGAGTDYCLFLIARYREELQRGVTPRRAPGIALRNVSGALAGSALTTILGLGVMAFAEYGKFASSGPVIALCLAVALAACVSFAPSLLRALGARVFWPVGVGPPREALAESTGVWAWVADLVLRRPAAVLLTCVGLMTPLAWVGWRAPTEHNLLAGLPRESASLRGAGIVGEYFGEGWLAPMKLLVRLPGADLSVPDARFDVSLLHNALYDLPSIQDVRSPYLPTGGDPKNQRRFSFGALYSSAAAGSPLSINTFVSSAPGLDGEVLQMSLILAAEPFSLQAREMIPRIAQALAHIKQLETLRGEPNPWRDAEFRLGGATPGLVDLQRVAASDQRRIQLYSVAAVLAVLLVLIRRPLTCLYLVATVLLSYWVTLGATHLFFSWLWGDAYQGLDWKAPIFLFVILVAVGQDYNIYLTTRVLEEQRRVGPREGLRRAIVQTGGIITSCGVIMAGTFVSMMAGSLRGMIELGFALSLGVLLDTFVVRTLLAPCYFSLRLPGRHSLDAGDATG